MRAIRLVAFVTTLCLLAPAPAGADGFLTPFIGYNFGGDSANCASLTSCNEKHTNFGVSIGSMSGLLGLEADIAYAKDFYTAAPGAESHVFTGMINLLIGIPTGPVQPYVLGGVGLIRPHVSLNPTEVTDNNALGYDIGGGVHVFFSRRAGVRGDLRHFHTFQDVSVLRLGTLFQGEKLDYWRASVGLTLRF